MHACVAQDTSLSWSQEIQLNIHSEAAYIAESMADIQLQYKFRHCLMNGSWLARAKFMSCYQRLLQHETCTALCRYVCKHEDQQGRGFWVSAERLALLADELQATDGRPQGRPKSKTISSRCTCGVS